MKRALLVVLTVALAATMLAGCSAPPAAETPAAPAPVAEAPKVEMPTKANPMVVDKAGKQVLIYAEVNRKWVTEGTRHGVVTAAGTNGDKAIFRAVGTDALEFNKAMFEIGGTAGDNVKVDSPAGTAVEGDVLDITIKWADKSYAINDLVTSTGELGGKVMEPKFGGNYELQSKAKTGCLYCLDSCAAGITSNAAVGWKSFDTGKVEFKGKGDLLPADGTPVTVVFALK